MKELPLINQRILVTREKKQAEAFAEKIETYGGQAFIADLIKIACLNFNKEKLPQEYQWIFFTSANGVNCFFRQTNHIDFQQVKFAAVGAKTNQALQTYGYKADFMPSAFDANTMAKEFLESKLADGKILLVRGNLSRPELIKAFSEAGLTFDCIEVYETAINTAAKKCLNDYIKGKRINVITFTSPSTVDAFMSLNTADFPESIKVVCIGPTTKKRALKHGFKKPLVPDEYTIEGMLQVMCQEVRK